MNESSYECVLLSFGYGCVSITSGSDYGYITGERVQLRLAGFRGVATGQIGFGAQVQAEGKKESSLALVTRIDLI